MPPLRIGLVGTGWIAAEHLSTLARLGDADVVAVCDLDESRARAAAPAGAGVYGDLDELLQREAPDALFVCTPPRAHRPPVLAALARGVHVFLEKPIARTLEDGAAIVAAVEASGLVCAIGYQWHGLELLEPLREALEEQNVGLLAGRSIGPTGSRPWFLDRAQGGGNVLERGSHQIDLQRSLGGEVAKVQAAPSTVQLAQGAGERGDIEDAATLVLHFAGGGLGTIQVAWTRDGLPGVYALDVVASEATLFVELDPEFRLHGVSRGRQIDIRARQHPSERTVCRFLEAVREHDPARVFCTPADARATLAVALACETALAGGHTVSVDA
ncbi:MAG: Gfo/Idh/MocA family protein [Gaiellaceae bacterium]